MKLHGKNLKLISTIEPDKELDELVATEGIIENMSEKRMYDFPITDKIVFRIVKDSEIIGEISLRNIKWFNRKAECSLFIKKSWQRKGVGQQAMRLLINHAFQTMNFVRLEGEVVEYNLGAQNLMEKLGFVKEGVLRQAKYHEGKYYNIIRYGLLKSEWQVDL